MFRWVLVVCALTVNAQAATFVVNSPADDADQMIGDGVCATAASECTLRAAIQEANATTAQDSIAFFITAPDPIYIAPSSQLPIITAPVVIDARTQPGWAGTPLVNLAGNAISVGGKTGLLVNLGAQTGCEIAGLAIRGWDNGVRLTSACTVHASYILENVIGVDASVSGAVIGGSAASDRNVIARNSFAGIFVQDGLGSRIAGNYIGTNLAGTTVDANGYGILFRAGADTEVANNLFAGSGIQIEVTTSGLHIHDNLFGTTASGDAPLGSRTMIGIQHKSSNAGQIRIERNTISNCTTAIDIWGASSDIVVGNFLGTTSAGTGSIPNETGVHIHNGGTANRIGGPAAADRNIIGSSQVAITVEASPANLIEGNWIGIDAASTPRPNVRAVELDGSGNVVRGNRIANNTGAGVLFGRDVRISRNSITANGGLGLETGTLGPTPNNPGDAVQDMPVVAAANTDGTSTFVRGTVTGAPSSVLDVEVFASPSCDPSGYGEGETFIGGATVTTDASGAGSFLIPASAATAGTSISTTATGTGTSEFSACVAVTNCPVIEIAPATLPGGMLGVAYAQSLMPSGGFGTYTLSSTGTLPPGLALAADGTLSGTPTTAGTFVFTVIATDQNGCHGQQSYTVSVCPPITVSPATIADGTTQTVYNEMLSATGGTPAYSFAVTSGAAPVGLTLATTGTLTGTPSAGGDFTFTVTATDANACTGSRSYMVHVDACEGVLEPASLPLPVDGVPYDEVLHVSGGAGPWTYAVSAGSLPAGLALAGDHITGTPTGVGSASFTITATDGLACSVARSYTLMTTCASIAIAPAAALPDGIDGESYSATLSATGGQAPYSFTAANLPPGLTLSAGGALSGTPQEGQYTFTVTATDANGCIGMTDYTLEVLASAGDGCGCASGGGNGLSSLLLVMLGVAAARRRR